MISTIDMSQGESRWYEEDKLVHFPVDNYSIVTHSKGERSYLEPRHLLDLFAGCRPRKWELSYPGTVWLQKNDRDPNEPPSLRQRQSFAFSRVNSIIVGSILTKDCHAFSPFHVKPGYLSVGLMYSTFLRGLFQTMSFAGNIDARRMIMELLVASDHDVSNITNWNSYASEFSIQDTALCPWQTTMFEKVLQYYQTWPIAWTWRALIERILCLRKANR